MPGYRCLAGWAKRVGWAGVDPCPRGKIPLCQRAALPNAERRAAQKGTATMEDLYFYATLAAALATVLDVLGKPLGRLAARGLKRLIGGRRGGGDEAPQARPR